MSRPTGNHGVSCRRAILRKPSPQKDGSRPSGCVLETVRGSTGVRLVVCHGPWVVSVDGLRNRNRKWRPVPVETHGTGLRTTRGSDRRRSGSSVLSGRVYQDTRPPVRARSRWVGSCRRGVGGGTEKGSIVPGVRGRGGTVRSCAEPQRSEVRRWYPNPRVRGGGHSGPVSPSAFSGGGNNTLPPGSF